MDFSLEIDQPGWLCLRVALRSGKSEFGRPLFAHTSPISFELRGRRIFQPEVAQQLLGEMQRSIALISVH